MIHEVARGCLTLLVAVATTKFSRGAEATATDILKIPNYHDVREGISRGGRPRAADVGILARRGVKTIVNLQGRDRMRRLRPAIEVYQRGERTEAIAAERDLVESLGMTFHHLPFNSLQPVSDADADQIMRAVEIIADPKNHPVFIHCEHGRDRTGLIVALERVLKEGWRPLQAYAEWTRYGHEGWLNKKFTGNLDVYFDGVMTRAGLMDGAEGLLVRGMMKVTGPKPAR